MSQGPVTTVPGQGRCELSNPTAMPRAAAFLWNQKMMLHVNCRGFVSAQHMQPEPGKYAHGPVMEAKTFMQPEQPYYAHHPGRFVYIKDEENQQLFSAPYEPVRKQAEGFLFSAQKDTIAWRVRDLGIEVRLELSLPADDALELWTLEICNPGTDTRQLSIYPYFTIGYMSWMNQSARYRPDLGGVVATSVSPYQKVEDYQSVKSLKDMTFLLHDTAPDAWECAREVFEGEGGLHCPDGVQQDRLGKGPADYETTAAVLQYALTLLPGESRHFRFIFGPAGSDAEIEDLRSRYLCDDGFEQARHGYGHYLDSAENCLEIKTPDPALDDFSNHWLGRQVFYHGSTNRLTTDPQTRNYLQDAMGMVYVQPQATRTALLKALSQQNADGSMPDGIRLTPDAELKYINQVPHSDHSVWLPICLQAYLDETGDYTLLDDAIPGEDAQNITVFDRIERAIMALLGERDERGLSLIRQGDWCDPMNMVGHQGKGVSSWLSMATVHALNCWSDVCRTAGREESAVEAGRNASELGVAIQTHFWDGDWFARGITDAGRVFGSRNDDEGRIFLNPQSWAMLSGIPSQDQQARMIHAVEDQLETPFGVSMLAPAFTRMHEDIGRITQKSPGSAENGSVYNHAAAFYVHALYRTGHSDRAFRILRQMLPGPDIDDLLQRGQLPVFIPNYYRGAWRQLPRTAGRSSQLFNTGTAAWFCRILVEDLFGLRGCTQGLLVNPSLPVAWKAAQVTRLFRGATFHVQYRRVDEPGETQIRVDGALLAGNTIQEFEAGQHIKLDITLGGIAENISGD